MNKLGLVLSGGGGKGAYEIGVWKYLKEIGLDKKISVISGTSVGGLNAALMESVDYETAESIWLNQIDDAILTPHSNPEFGSVLTEGIFSRDGLIGIIKQIPTWKIGQSSRSIYVTCSQNASLFTSVIGGTRQRIAVRLNRLSPAGVQKYLLATSAIPGVFKPEVIEGVQYFDGGFKGALTDGKLISYLDNTPLTPVAKEHCTHAIIVHLDVNNKTPTVKDRWNNSVSEKNELSSILDIFPSQDLGDLFTGTLNFNPDYVKDKIVLGYLDAKHRYGKELQSLVSSFDDVITIEQSETLCMLRKYIYEMTGFLERSVYVGNDVSLVESEVRDMLLKAESKISFHQVIGYIPDWLLFTDEGFLFKKKDLASFLKYHEIHTILHSPSPEVGILEDDLVLRGNFSTFSGYEVVVPGGSVLRGFLSEMTSEPDSVHKRKRKEEIRNCIIKYTECSSDGICSRKQVQMNTNLLHRAEKSLSFCSANLCISDILAYKDLSLLRDGSDFFMLTVDGIHYKTAAQKYYCMEYGNIREIIKGKVITVEDKRDIALASTIVHSYLKLDYLNDVDRLYTCLESIRTLYF